MGSYLVRPGLMGLILTLSSLAPAQAPDPRGAGATGETPGLKATQITLAIDRDGSRRKFRATVVARKDDELTVLTVAHGISPDDVDGPASILLDRGAISGTITSVVRNPAYKPNPSREIPGPDNAVARIRIRPVGREAVEAAGAIRAVEGLATRTYPGPSGQTVLVRMIDQNGVEHAVKAGNHSNPRFLEWGPAYLPIAGDSGGGVFAMSGGAAGRRSKPVLIGIIVGRDDHGGMASLVSREWRWMAEELAR